MSPIIAAGRTLELAYPTHNRFGLPLEFTDRHIEVKQVCDFSLGLAAKHIIRRPLVRRGRLLVVGIETDTRALRRFWLDAQHGRELPAYRLGLYYPLFPGEVIDWIGPVFGPTERERLAMRDVARRWYGIVRERGEIGLRLAAYPWE